MSADIDFYFDFSSSYSYAALPDITRLAEEYDVTVKWKPILLGVIFNALNHAPPAGDSIKMRYVKRDLERCAETAGLPPFQFPSPFPFNGITASRVFWHLADSDTDKAIAWARAVFHASFAEGRDCSNPEVLAEIAKDLSHDAKDLFEASGEDTVKAKLKEVTGEAMQRGVFGAPTFFVGDEMFWGGDRLPHLEHYLKHA